MMSNLCRKIAASKSSTSKTANNKKKKNTDSPSPSNSSTPTKKSTKIINTNSTNTNNNIINGKILRSSVNNNNNNTTNVYNNDNMNVLKLIQNKINNSKENNNNNLLNIQNPASISSSNTSSTNSSLRLQSQSSSTNNEFITTLNRNFENLKICASTNNNRKNNMQDQESENAVSESLYKNESIKFTQNYKPLNKLENGNQEEEIVVTAKKQNEMFIPTTKIIEHHARFVDESAYDMTHTRRGTALIINNKRFDPKLEMPTRDGTDKDACALEFALYKLGFEVKTAHNCTALFMREILYKLAKTDHSNADCFLCVIMSHGENGIVYGVDREVEIEQLIQPFKFSRTLAGKPKLFFIQACRGSKLMDGIDSNPMDNNYISKIPMEADFLIAYSTVAGYYSWRNSQNGSWFIQSLCQVLNEYGSTFELMKLLTSVNRRVAYYFESNTNDPYMNGKKQVPCIVSMLTKEVYFQPKVNITKSCQISYA